MERQTVPGATKRPKEPIGPLARFRRCKHLRLGSFEPRSVVVTADASTCDHAFGPSWPLRAEPTVRARWRVWLWAYPRTSDRTGASERVVHGPSTEPVANRARWVVEAGRQCAAGRRSPAEHRTVPGARRVSGAKSGPGHGNARRNRRSSAESPRASSSGLKAPAHRPLRAKSTMTCPAGPWLPAYPRPSRLGGRNQGGCPPPVHVAAEHREVRGPGRNETPEGTNRSAGPFPPMQAPATRFLEPRSVVVTADASTCDHAFGPSWPLRAEPTVRARWRVWLWAYPRTSDRTGASERVVHGPSTEPVANRARWVVEAVRERVGRRWPGGLAGGQRANSGGAERQCVAGRCPPRSPRRPPSSGPARPARGSGRRPRAPRGSDPGSERIDDFT